MTTSAPSAEFVVEQEPVKNDAESKWEVRLCAVVPDEDTARRLAAQVNWAVRAFR